MMGKPTTRALGAVLAGMSAAMLVGCASVVAGVAMKAPVSANSDGAVVALMDTGNYPTSARPPYGTAGSQSDGLILEANRMAEYVVGPWEIDARLSHRDPVRTAPMNSVQYLDLYLGFWEDPRNTDFDAIAAAHGYITGFSTARNPEAYPIDVYLTSGWQGLTNEVMRFPDDAAAAAAASEMAAVEQPPPSGYSPEGPVTIDNNPEAIASGFTNDADQKAVVASFTAHGPYVLYQQARADRAEDPLWIPINKARDLVSVMLHDQKRSIDRFVATDPANLADLPEDPSGRLAARTIFPLDHRDAPAGEGVWQPDAWLHFEDDPINSATLFTQARVEAVAQGLTTVYQTHDATGAVRVVDRFAADLRAMADVEPITGVPGLPGARCSERVIGAAAPTFPLPIQQAAWHFKCVAQADRYAFSAFSAQEKDVKQQIAAQYRILAGK